MTMRVDDGGRIQNKVNGGEGIREQRDQKIGSFAYVAVQILMRDHTGNAGKNG